MSIKLTESRLRQIIKEEAAKLLREGETFALKPGTPMPKVGDRIPASSVTRGMSDIEGPGSERARAMAAKSWEPKAGSYAVDDYFDDEAAQAVLKRFRSSVRDVVDAHGVRVAKWLGDVLVVRAFLYLRLPTKNLKLVKQ